MLVLFSTWDTGKPSILAVTQLEAQQGIEKAKAGFFPGVWTAREHY